MTRRLNTNCTNYHEYIRGQPPVVGHWCKFVKLVSQSIVSELLYKQEIFQLVGVCMEIDRELGKGHDEVIYKNTLIVELAHAGIPFSREKNYKSLTKELSGLTF